MNKKTKILGTITFLVLLAGIVIASSYNFNNKIQKEDINVFFSKTIIEAKGTYNAIYEDGKAHGMLRIIAKTEEQKREKLLVHWNSKNGINITQDDEYAIKFTTNARIKHNKINSIEKIYVHYSKISGNLVIRGRGFRIETKWLIKVFGLVK